MSRSREMPSVCSVPAQMRNRTDGPFMNCRCQLPCLRQACDGGAHSSPHLYFHAELRGEVQVSRRRGHMHAILVVPLRDIGFPLPDAFFDIHPRCLSTRSLVSHAMGTTLRAHALSAAPLHCHARLLKFGSPRSVGNIHRDAGRRAAEEHYVAHDRTTSKRRAGAGQGGGEDVTK